MVLTPFDWMVLVLVLFFSISGFMKGFIREVITLISHVAALVLSFKYYDQLFGYIKGAVPKGYEATGEVVSFVIIYVAVVFVMFLLEKLFTGTLKTLKLNILNRILGLAFGAMKGLFIASVIFIISVTFFPKSEKALSKSKSYPIVKRFSEVIVRLSSEKFRNNFINREFAKALGKET